MEDWIKRHQYKLFVLFFLAMLGSVYAHSLTLPRELQNSIIPNLNKQIEAYDYLIEDYEYRLEWMNKRIALLAELEERKVKRPPSNPIHSF